VLTAGAQTIAGTKTFSAGAVFGNGYTGAGADIGATGIFRTKGAATFDSTASIGGELTGAGPKQYLSVPLESVAGAVTTYTGVIAPHRAMTITKGSIAFVVCPSDTAGNCTFTLTKNASTNLLSTASITTNGGGAKTVVDLSLNTGASLILADNDMVYAAITGFSETATAGTGGILTLEYTLQ
jgi:hypothetical protein